jgi:hypothetical protein
VLKYTYSYEIRKITSGKANILLVQQPKTQTRLTEPKQVKGCYTKSRVIFRTSVLGPALALR